MHSATALCSLLARSPFRSCAFPQPLLWKAWRGTENTSVTACERHCHHTKEACNRAEPASCQSDACPSKTAPLPVLSCPCISFLAPIGCTLSQCCSSGWRQQLILCHRSYERLPLALVLHVLAQGVFLFSSPLRTGSFSQGCGHGALAKPLSMCLPKVGPGASPWETGSLPTVRLWALAC